MKEKIATDNDHRVIDATSIALKGLIGRDDDVIRWAQDLKKVNINE